MYTHNIVYVCMYMYIYIYIYIYLQPLRAEREGQDEDAQRAEAARCPPVAAEGDLYIILYNMI